MFQPLIFRGVGWFAGGGDQSGPKKVEVNPGRFTWFIPENKDTPLEKGKSSEPKPLISGSIC